MNAQPVADSLDQYGPLLNAVEMARIFGITRSAFYKNAQAGKYDVFRVHPALGPRCYSKQLGPRCYSKQLVARYLAGEPLESRVFGRKRSA